MIRALRLIFLHVKVLFFLSFRSLEYNCPFSSAVRIFMLKGILTLLVFQFIGECLAKLFMLKVPGAIIGMVFLLLFLILRKKSFHALDNSVFWLLRYLPLFILPSAVGIMTQFDTIANEALAILCSLVVGTFISLCFSAKLMDILISKKEQCHEH